jgi:cell wall-associated NlpC family hydrolase
MSLARARFCALALEQLGKPCLWARRGPDAFDCSGVVAWLLNQIGGPDLRATHNAQLLHDESPALETYSVPPMLLSGDLLFYGHDAGSVSHVAIAVRGGMALSADGATPHILKLEDALANPLNRVRLHSSVRFRKDLPYFSAHRNTWVDALELVCR